MDTIIDEILNEAKLWTKAIVDTTLQGWTLGYNMILARYEYLRQEQEKKNKPKNKAKK